MLRRPPALRPIAPTPTPQARIFYRPKTSMPGGLKTPSKDKGFFANVGNLIAFPGTVIKALPTIGGKLAQTAYGFGEGALDLTLDIAAKIAGREKEFFTSRFEKDLEKGRKLGLKGIDLIAYSTQRQYPFGSDIVKGYAPTLSAIGEFATLGQKDFGEPGFDYYQAYKRGELPQRLLGDVGNVMLAGRMLGLGNVAARAGKLATEAGATRLGTAVRRTGYLSEQPIAATVRGAARLAGRALPETPGRLGRIAGISERVSLSERPLRALLEENVANRRALYTERLGRLDQEIFDVNQQVSAMRQRGEQIPEELAAKQENLNRQREAAFQATGLPKLAKQTTRRLNQEAETRKNLHVQALASFNEKGPVQQSVGSLRRNANQIRKQAQRSSNPVETESYNAIADQVEKFANAKESDTGNRMTERQYIDDSMSANILINTGMVDPIKRDLDAGVITFDEAVALLVSDEVSTMLADQGYRASPSAVQRALDYVNGQADLIDQVGIESAQSVTGRFSNYMEAMRQSGQGQVRGAASPFETANSPLPEFFFKELQLPTRSVINGFLRDYVGNIIEALLKIEEQRTPDIRQQLGVENVAPDKLLEIMQDAPKDGAAYALAYQAIQQAFDEFSRQPDPRFTSFPEQLTPNLIETVRNFLRDPMIYPAKMRGMMAVERRLLRFARGRDVETFAAGLEQFVTDYPDLLTTAQYERIFAAIDEAMTDTGRYDANSWKRLRTQLAAIDRNLTASMDRLTQEAGALDARRQNALLRINELRAALQMAQQYVEKLVANPEQFFPTETPEVARLRGVAAEARAAQQAMGEVSPLPKVDTYRERLELDADTQRTRRKIREAEQEIIQETQTISGLQYRRRAAEEITWEDEGALQAELELAKEIRDQVTEGAEFTKEEAKARKEEEILALERLHEQYVYSTGSLAFSKDQLKPTTYGSEDLIAAIYEGIGPNRGKNVYNAFVRRFSKPSPPKGFNPQQLVVRGEGGQVVRRMENPYSTNTVFAMADEWAEAYFPNLRLDTRGINDIIPAFVRAFVEDYDNLVRIRQLKKMSIENYRQYLNEEQVALSSSLLESEYRRAGVRSPEELIRLLGDYENPNVINKAIVDAQNRIDAIRSRIPELERRIKYNEGQWERLSRAEQQSIPKEQLAEQARLRGIEEEATTQAEALVSENLAAQQAGVKSRLRGVGKVVQGEAKPPVKPINMARTGEPVTIRGYRGTGNIGMRGVGEDSILGPGLYIATTLENAQDYARDYTQPGQPIVGNVTEAEVSLRNPFVISSSEQWNALTKAAGWEFPNPRRFSTPDPGGALARRDIANLRSYVESLGHDGIIVDTRGISGGFASILGGDQVVVFDTEAMPSGRAPRGVLQRQFEGPAQAEEARLLDRQAKDARVVEQKRAEFAAQDQARTQAQGIVAEATATAQQLEQPVGPALLGEGRRLQYIPFGPSGVVEQVSSVSKRPGTEGAPPETVGSYEKMRTSSIVPLSPSQVTARIKETLSALGRNVTMGKILTDRNFVSSVAESVPQEVRDALMRDAESLNPPTVGIDTKTRAKKVEADYKRLLAKELDRMGLEVVSPVEFPDPSDPFASRQAVGALKERVRSQDIEDNSIVMTKGLREIIGTEFEQVPSTKVPEIIQRRFAQLQRLTGNWKGVILPFSVRWQVGDLVGNVINAWVRGDIPPSDLWKYFTDAYDMLRESQLTPEGQPTRLRNIMFGEELGGYTGDPLLQIMQSLGLQSSGGNMADTMSMLRDTGSPMVDYIEGRQYRSTRAGKAFGKFQRSAFALNEFHNRLLRQAVALKNLDEYLQSRDMTFDSVTYETVARDPALEKAIIDAVSEANRILGNFSDMTPFERQTVRTIFPFWSWMKFINKAAAQLVLDQPDRVLFMSHLASATMEPDAEGLWEFLQGKTRIFGGLYDLSFLNPYSDAMIFSGKNFNQMLANFIAESESISPAFTLPLYGVGEAFYQARGGQPFLFPTFSRPSYLEGRPGETTRTLGDTLGGLAYYGLRQFGGPARNILEALPVSGTIPGTDIAYGFSGVPRFPQGSLRTTGRYATPLLTPEQGRLSAVMRTFGLPARLADVGRAEQIARQGVRAGRQTRLRRVTERRLAERKMR